MPLNVISYDITTKSNIVHTVNKLFDFIVNIIA